MRNWTLYWDIARRLRRQPRRSKAATVSFMSFISTASTLGIALGCMVFITGLSVMNGFSEVLEKRFLSLIPHVEFTAVDGQLNDPQGLIDKALDYPGVAAARPVIRTQAMLQKGTEFIGLQVHGIDHTQTQPIQNYMSAAAWQGLTKPNSVILGSGLASTLAVEEGASITLLVATANSFKQPRRVQLKVAGIFEFGGQVDHQFAYVNLATARNLVGLTESVSGIEVVLDDVFSAQLVTNELGRQLNEYLYLDSWMRTQGHLYRDIQLVRLVMYLVLVLVLAVACFNIVSTLIMTVQEKHRHIGILRTMGVRPVHIMRIFFWQGIQNGLLGVTFGVIAGVSLSLSLPELTSWLQQLTGEPVLNSDVYFIETIPVQLQLLDSVGVALVALVMSALATLYPAWQAAQLDIVKAIE